MPRNPLARIAGVAALTALASCSAGSGGSTSGGGPAPRTFRMGFSANPPRPSQTDLLAALDLWTRRGDIAIMPINVPYKALLTGTSATAYVDSNDLPVARYFRARGFPIIMTLDVTNGLDRSAEAPDLVALGRSITEPAVQQVYRDYVAAVTTIVHPDYLFLVTESNLIRHVAPGSLYDAVVTMANAAAGDVAALPAPHPRLGVTVQVDDAWGRLLDNNVYQGVDHDFQDFPFIAVLGLSSYPYFVFSDPDAIPGDYYSRLLDGRPIPEIVTEGGWTSASVAGVVSTPQAQARYLRRQEQLLDSARALAVVQLDFTDIDTLALNLPPGTSLGPFSQLGLVDMNLNPKPALATWDSIFARPLK